jgi:serine protease
MVGSLHRAFAVLALVALIAPGAATAQSRPPADETVSRLIVKLRDTGKLAAQARAETAESARLARFTAAAAAVGGVAVTHVRPMALGAHLMALDRRMALTEAEALAATLARDPDVEFVHPDVRRQALRTANDPWFDQQWYLRSVPGGIYATDAWDITTGAASIVVAVVDTGYRPHEDLAGRLLPGYDFIANPKIANDGDGRDADASDPGDWISAGDLADPDFAKCRQGDSSWHGTGVAGVIAAVANNGLYVAGIDWSAKILPVRVLGKCGGYDSDIIDGIAWAAGLPVPGVPLNPNPAQIINISLGGQGAACPAAYHSVFGAALAHGVTRAIVTAAGNDAIDVAGAVPANCSETLAVAATAITGNLASYSNFGGGIVVSAPGGMGPTRTGAEITVLNNTGTTTPKVDNFGYFHGTSVAAPMVSAVASLVLAVAPGLSAAQLRSVLTGSASPFAATSTCTSAKCGAGIVNAKAAVLAAQPGGAALNYQGIWWNSPAGSESGWGINFAHQGDTLFASWFTYDLAGSGAWYVMTAQKSAPATYTGTLYRTRGPRFDSVPFDPAAVTSTPVGTGTLAFADGSNGTFSYTVDGVAQTKSITRQVFGPQPACAWGATSDLAAATNYQDLWWKTPAGSESGWGINLNHQGDTIFATWFTYDVDGSPMWLVVTAQKTFANTFTGDLYRTAGARFDAFNPAAVVATKVGTATFTFANGNQATFGYTVQTAAMPAPASQSKTITREVFGPPGTVCR